MPPSAFQIKWECFQNHLQQQYVDKEYCWLSQPWKYTVCKCYRCRCLGGRLCDTLGSPLVRVDHVRVRLVRVGVTRITRPEINSSHDSVDLGRL